MKNLSFFGLPCLLYTGTLAVVLFALGPGASAQSDDFNDGNDNGWTRFDLSAAGFPPSLYSFPPDGSGGKAYRIFSPAPPMTNAGAARAMSYRADVTYTNFTLTVDLVAWDATLHQTFGLLVRGANIGVGQTTGYVVNYVHLRPGDQGGDFQINRISGEAPATIAHAGVTLDPARKYRLVATGSGSHLVAKIYDLSDLTLPVAATEVVDATYASGVMGLFEFSLITGDAVTNSTSTADVTFDNYMATGSAPTNEPPSALDDFSDGNDAGWTHLDLSAAGLPASTYSFPPDGLGGFAYRIFSPAPPVNSAGPARAMSYQAGVAYTNFTAAIDFVAWDDNLNQAFGLLTRGTTIGLGRTSGYVFNYNPHQVPGQPGGELQINRVGSEQDFGVAAAEVTLDPTRRYRLVATGFGSYFVATIYDLADLTTPVAMAQGIDATYASGIMGLFIYSRSAGTDQTNAISNADATFDNFFASGSAPTNTAPTTIHTFHGAPQVVDSTTLTTDSIDDFTQHSYATNAGPIGSFADCSVTRLFATPIQSIRVTLVSGVADDIGYVGSVLVTSNSAGRGPCAGAGSVTNAIDVTSQIQTDGSRATLLLRAQENCCCLTGWGSETHPTHTNATLHWEVHLGPPPPPSVVIASPANGSVFSEPASIPVSVSLTPSNATVQAVRLYVQNTVVGVVTNGPYNFVSPLLTDGAYCFRADAINASGATISSSPTICITVTNPAVKRYALIDLGALANSYDSRATAINNAGVVVGQYMRVADYFGFVYSNNVFSYLPLLGYPPGGAPGASATAINDLGQITGYSTTTNNYRHAFLYDNGVLNDLGTLGSNGSVGFGINNSGVVVGNSALQDLTPRGFIFTDGVMQPLGTLGGQGSEAFAVNNLGQVVGDSDIGNYVTHAFLYDATQGMRDLGDLGSAYPDSWAQGINDLGQVVGYALNPGNAMHGRGFLYDGVMRSVGTLGGDSSRANAINNHGQIVGTSNDYDNEPHAFVWQDGLMYDLNHLVPPNSGWRLQVANHINECGQIVGYGNLTTSERYRAFLLTPTPTTLVCPPDLVVTNRHDQSSSVVRYSPAVTGDCSGIVCNPPSGSAFGIGSYTVTCSVVDGAGTSNQCNFQVTVLPGNVPPVPVIEVAPLASFPGYTNLIVLASDNRGAMVDFDGSSSYDLDDTNFDYFWYAGTNLFSTNAVASEVLSVGTHQITLVLNDTFPLGVSQTNVTVEVIAPAEGVTLVAGLIQASGLARKDQQRLLASLSVAAASFQRGNNQAGVAQLEAFQRKVQQELMGSHPALANELIAAAQVVIDGVTGPARSPVEAVEKIIAMVDDAPLPQNRKQPLLASLVAALRAFERGHFEAGVNHLKAFEHKVQAQVARSHPALARKLIAAAQQVVAKEDGR